MSKIKISFSLILTFILVGILSTSVFARGAYWGSLTANGQGFSFKFINTSDDPTKDFSVKVYERQDSGEYTLKFTSAELNDVPAYPEPTGAAAEYRTITIPQSTDPATGVNYQAKIIYKFVLMDGATPTETKFAVNYSHENPALASIANDPNGLLDVDGSGITNANHTGQPGTAKKGGNTHGFYQNNTNSCAGCHQTHTAANGEALLFKDGVYSTCSACHDGTTGAYNAFATANEETPNEIAGTFNIKTDSTHNGSLHQSDGSIKVSAAPGGNTKSVSGNVIWGNEFNCASCHAPHGSGSTAENNLNMDPLGWGGVEYKALPSGVTLANATESQKDSLNGKLFKDLSIYDIDANGGKLPASMTTPYIVAKKTVAASDLSTDTKAEGYLYTRANVTVGKKVIQTYRWTGKAYAKDYSLWLRGSSREPANTILTGAGTGLTFVWRDGFAFGDAGAVDAVTKAQISLGIDVETTTDIRSLFDNTFDNYIYDSGTEMSKYCASCHTDYLSNVRTNETGVYTQAHRHTTGNDKLTCVRCHFGHGTDATIMKDANDESQFTSANHKNDLSYFVDPNPSSALKRYTGMSVCYACHGSGGQFINNPNNNHIDPVANDPVYGSHSVGPVAGDALKSGQPGTPRQ
ncbi:cytochrome c3 family protein [Neobacillus cucumis]|uniref:Doubled CXXCH motif domain-containing protein n=1 Tax=Neobacillus cucumis TaxID=1740721 RepID=A0A2N5HFR4_9BACI|nr:cytochrome c3 family protein [Neobacillus cucumis]PLS04347.1 hypothetical protein CVD27_11925 [Neobacillus cucumis]